MIPSPLVLLILILAAYRLTRLAGWDDFPLAAKLRAWVIGEYRVPLEHDPLVGGSIVPRSFQPFRMSPIGKEAMREAIYDDPEQPELPGKQPSSEVAYTRPAYKRPTIAHLVHCPFCVGWWISLATWLVWLAWHPVAYGLVPLAISGAVGLIAKNLDA